MRKIKILRILNRFNLGGPIYNVTYLTKYLDKNKYETLLIGGKCQDHELSAKYILEDENVSYKEIKYMKRNLSIIYDIISLIQIIHIVYKYKPDIIHTHASKAGFLGRLASIFYVNNVKVVHTYHGNVFEGYFSKFKNKLILIVERFLAINSDKIIAISELQKKDIVDKYSICSKEKICVINLGFDLKKFSQFKFSQRNMIRKKFRISENEVLIAIIGRVVPIKNHKLFIDVINYCRRKTNIRLKALVVGDGPETKKIIDYADSLKLKCSYKNIENNYDIFFCSWIKDVQDILTASDIVALTSYNEGTPVSIIEGMASGKAVISTDVGGVSDIIENNKSGIISNSEIINFGDSLLSLICDKNLRIMLGNNAKKRSFQLFNYDVLVNNMENLYESLLIN